MREIFIDVENGSNNTIKVTQGDNLTESYKLIITENKIRLDLTNKKVKFAFVKSDSHYGDIIEELKILNAIEGEVEFEVVNRITKVDGLYSCGLAVYDDKGFLEHTGTFSLYVRESIFEKVSGELIKNSAYKELISLLDRATNLNKEIDPIVINAEEKTNTLKENIKVADNSNKTLVDNTEKANTLNNTLVENTNEAKKTNEDAVIKDNTLKETIKAAEANNNNKLIHTNDNAKEINDTLVKNMNEVKEVNENAINIKTSLENNINQATNLKSDLETEINKSVLANNTLIKSIDNSTETNKDFINKDSNLKETIKNAENINEELSENENKATLNEATRKKNEAERIEAEKIREEKIKEFGLQVNKNTKNIADNSKDIERAFETINDNSFIPFTGEDITVEHSKVGFTKDMQVEGMTYQNLIKTPKIIGGNSVGDINIQIKENTKYAFIAEFEGVDILQEDTALITCTNVFLLDKPNAGDELYIKTVDGGLGTEYRTTSSNVIKTSNKVIINFTTKKNEIYLNVRFGGSIIPEKAIMKNITLLEGDYTQSKTYIPSYFEGIKSVGEKENKISILSTGKNICNVDKFSTIVLEGSGEGAKTLDKVIKYNIEVNPNKTYTLSYTSNFANFNNCKLLGCKIPIPETIKDHNTAYTFCVNNGGQERSETITGFRYITITTGGNFIADTTIKVGDTINLKIQLEEGNKSVYEPYQLNKKEILLPFSDGLKGLPSGVKDITLLKEDGLYIRQKVDRKTFNGTENWYKAHYNNSITEESDYIEFGIDVKNAIYNQNTNGICNMFNNIDCGVYAKEGFQIFDGQLRITISKSKIESKNLEGFKKWLQANPITVYYELSEPIEHKIADLNSINLETFKDVTYVSSENEIKPNLSFKAPVDIPATISTLKAANTMLIAKNTGLENKNKQLEKVNNKQTEKINQLDEATTALISSALM